MIPSIQILVFREPGRQGIHRENSQESVQILVFGDRDSSLACFLFALFEVMLCTILYRYVTYGYIRYVFTILYVFRCSVCANSADLGISWNGPLLRGVLYVREIHQPSQLARYRASPG